MGKKRLRKLNRWARMNALECIFPWWTSEYIIDREHGGFYGRVTIDMQRLNDEPRGLTLTGRMLYAFSAAYRTFRGQIYRDRAEYTFKELVDRFYDREFGGAFTAVSEKGDILTEDKPNYCEAFLIMGCAEYHRATGDAEALRIAMETFELMETKAKTGPGTYRSSMTRDWRPGEGSGFGKPGGGKGPVFPEGAIMFPHHLCQAYLRLYEATGDERVGAALRELTEFAAGTLYDPRHHNFKSIITPDGARIGTHQSFGHDCEISYLLVNAAKLTCDGALQEKVRERVTDVLTNVLENDFDPYGSLYDGGDLTSDERSPVHVWWAQAEAVSAMLCGYGLTRDKRFLKACERQVEVIDRWFVNREHGDWYNNILMDGEGGHVVDGMHGFDKVNFGKCPFHNAQMCFEVMARTGHLIKELDA